MPGDGIQSRWDAPQKNNTRAPSLGHHGEEVPEEEGPQEERRKPRQAP
jgi:hypothetical protein